MKKKNLKPPKWAILATVLLAVGTVWLRLLIVRTTYSINQTERTIQNLQQEKEQVELSLAGMRSPRKLEPLARQRYGLTQPKSSQVVHLK